MEKLRGRNALVTGASRGLGVHIARALAREGANLILVARSAADLETVREEMVSLGVDAIALPADLADTSRVESLAGQAERALGGVDILVNNAGVESSAPYQDLPSGDVVRAVKVNLLAPMLLTRALLAGMLDRGRGHVVNMSSLAGKTGLPYQTPYGTTKAGLVMFTHSLRIELLEEPVGVSVICPGFVAGDGMYARIEESVGAAPALMRPTSPERVAGAVVRAIRKDVAELIVNPLPMRPVTVLREVLPGITPHLHRWFGTADFGRSVAAGRAGEGEPGREPDSPPPSSD